MEIKTLWNCPVPKLPCMNSYHDQGRSGGRYACIVEIMIIFQVFHGLVSTFFLFDAVKAYWCILLECLVFLIVCVPSPLSWKVYLSLLRCSHNSKSSLRFLETKLNPCSNTCFWYSEVSLNSMRSIIMLSGSYWYTLIGNMCFGFLTKLLTQKMNLCILESWGSNIPVFKYFSWGFSELGGKKCFVKHLMTSF